jgi:hypothetical protein
MSQKLFLGGNQYMEVDVMFRDFGVPAQMGLVGGNVIQIAAPRAARPDLCYAKGQGFFHMDRTPVTDLEDIGPVPSPQPGGHIPEPYWSMAKQFIEENAATAKPLPAKKVKAAAAPPPPRRKPGRPAKTKAPVVIDGPEAFERVAGVSESVAEAQAR